MDSFDRIGLAELIPDSLVLMSSLLLPKFFKGMAGSPVYKQAATTLSEQFMPHKDGRGFQDEILLAEVTMLLSPETKNKFEALLLRLSKGEKQFLSGAIALFAAKYQKEKKSAQKTNDTKDVAQTTASLEPLTVDNPAIKFLEQLLIGEDRSVEETIELLRSKNMIHETFAGKVRIKFEQLKLEHGEGAKDAVIAELEQWIESKSFKTKQTVGPLGFFFAFVMGRGKMVEMVGTAKLKSIFERVKSWKHS